MPALEIESYDTHKDGLMDYASSTRLTAVAMKGEGRSIGGQKHFPFCIPILCYAPPCPCMGSPIIWIPAKAIFSKQPTGEKTSEGYDLFELNVQKRTAVILEKPARTTIERISAAQKAGSARCGSEAPKTLAKGISILDALGGPRALVKAAFAAGYAAGTAADDALDGGLSDQGAEYIEDIVDWFGDLF